MLHHVGQLVCDSQIVSASRDKTIKLWNTLGECKYTWDAADGGHTDWVSCVRFSPTTTQPVIVSGGWDKQIKVWDLTLSKVMRQHNLVGHSGYINAVTVSPDGSLCASGGKDATAMLWDLTEGKRLYMLDAGDIIHAVCFSPMRYWLVAATQKGIKVWPPFRGDPVSYVSENCRDNHAEEAWASMRLASPTS